MAVDFNEEQQKASILYARFQSSSKPPTLVEWLLKKGIVKNQSQANAILVLLTIVCLVLSAYIFYSFTMGRHVRTVVPKDITYVQVTRVL